MRINKYLAECGLCSRRKADEFVKAGRVSVNKKVIYEVGTNVDEQKDVVYFDGKKVVRALHYDYVMFNKPKGCVTTSDDARDNKSGRPALETSDKADKIETKRFFTGESANTRVIKNDKAEAAESVSSDRKPRRTVFDYLGEYSDKRLFPVGRLDYDSEGLLLLTNDGNMTYKLTHPSSEIPKTYIVRIEGSIEESDLAILRKGVTVDGVKYGRCKVKVTGIEENATRLEVIIFEGKNREIRKMFQAVEKNVTFLKRTAIGDLRLGGLSRGGYRELSEVEIAYLRKLCGLN